MSYSEKDGTVILTMSREDYDKLLMLLGGGTAALCDPLKPVFRIADTLALLNRLNQGNPNYTPYQVEEKNG